MKYDFLATLWLYQGDGAWVFVNLPKDISAEIKTITQTMRKGFGSVKVSASVKGVTWDTSMFPDSKTQSFVLPIKKDVRNTASITVGDTCRFLVQLKDIL